MTMLRFLLLSTALWLALLPANAATPGKRQGSSAATLWQAHAGQARAQPGYDWSTPVQEGGTSRLLYGKAHSDDVPLELACRHGSGQVELLVMTMGEGPSVMQLMTPDTQVAIDARTALDTDFNITLQRARLDSRAPIFTSIARHQAVAVMAHGQWKPLLPHPGTHIDIESFLARCQRGNHGVAAGATQGN